jgi:signal transduction histidine kinase
MNLQSLRSNPFALLIPLKRRRGLKIERDQVRLSVRDVGIRFDPQAADQLFGALYTMKNEGMGIGLSVSRSIIEAHHGHLWAEPNDGPGATFSFSVLCDRGI